MKGMFLKKSNIYNWKWATVVQKFQLSMTKLGTHDEIRWFDGTGGYGKVRDTYRYGGYPASVHKCTGTPFTT